MEKVRWEILVGAAVIAAAIFLKPTSPVQRYTISPDGSIRLDAITGEMVTCAVPGRCRLVGPAPKDEKLLQELDRVGAEGNSN